MNCSTVRPWLFKHLDGELHGSEKECVEAHLATCVSCQREWRLLSIPRRIGQAIPVLEPSPFFYQKLRAKLQNQRQNVTIWQIILGLSRHLVPGLAAVTLALLSVFIYFQLKSPAVDISQVYENIFVTAGDRPQHLIVEDQNEITDESVLSAIAEEESARRPPATEPQNK